MKIVAPEFGLHAMRAVAGDSKVKGSFRPRDVQSGHFFPVDPNSHRAGYVLALGVSQLQY